MECVRLASTSTPDGLGEVTDVVWSPDGTRLAAASSDEVYVWDAANGRASHKLSHLEVSRVAWSPDSTRLALGSADGTVRIWSIPTKLMKKRGVVYGKWYPDHAPDPRPFKYLDENKVMLTSKD